MNCLHRSTQLIAVEGAQRFARIILMVCEDSM